MAAVREIMALAVLIHAKTFCSVDNAGIHSFTSIAKPPALHLWRRRQQPSSKLDYLFNLSLSKSMVARFFSFVPHGEH